MTWHDAVWHAQKKIPTRLSSTITRHWWLTYWCRLRHAFRIITGTSTHIIFAILVPATGITCDILATFMPLPVASFWNSAGWAYSVWQKGKIAVQEDLAQKVLENTPRAWREPPTNTKFTGTVKTYKEQKSQHSVNLVRRLWRALHV